MTSDMIGYMSGEQEMFGEMTPGGSGTTTTINYDDTEIRKLINNKVDKEEGKSLSSNDFTNEYKTKLDNSLTNESDPTVPDFVKNIKEEDIKNWNNKSEFDGSYNNLSDVPTEFNPKSHAHNVNDINNLSIPSKTSELENDSGYITREYVNEVINTAIVTAIGGEY